MSAAGQALTGIPGVPLALRGPAPVRVVAGFGFWLFLLSDIIIFAALFATYSVLSGSTAGGPVSYTHLRARRRVQQLERELRGEPARAEEPLFVPEFLRKQVAGGLATTTGSQRASSERPLILENAQETGRSRRSVRIFVLS